MGIAMPLIMIPISISTDQRATIMRTITTDDF
jgi:hypothetical protein